MGWWFCSILWSRESSCACEILSLKAWLLFILPLCFVFFFLPTVLNEAIGLRMNACTQDDGRDGLVEHCTAQAEGHLDLKTASESYIGGGWLCLCLNGLKKQRATWKPSGQKKPRLGCWHALAWSYKTSILGPFKVSKGMGGLEGFWITEGAIWRGGNIFIFMAIEPTGTLPLR